MRFLSQKASLSQQIHVEFVHLSKILANLRDLAQKN